jgi:RNA polymerase II subunit A C-terminal domain phosphatase
MRAQNSIVLEAQVEERILAKKQEEIEKEEGAEEAKPPERMSPDAFVDGNVDVSVEEPKHHRKALLKNDDVELDRVKRVSASLSI